MSLRIIKHGIADTIQDTGRHGFQHLGINPGGAMDTIAAQTANILVGNDVNDAVIEIHFPASVFLFTEDAVIALSGADLGAKVNHIHVPINTPVVIEKNCVLQFKKIISGARCYLSVRGGFDLPKWLNSYSTNTKAAAGGFEGRRLQKEDELSFRSSKKYCPALCHSDCSILHWKADIKEFYPTTNAFRVLAGTEYNWLEETSKKLFTGSKFVISPQSDRMGYRMKGEALSPHHSEELLSSAVTKGTIQLLPDGQIIILMADHQTTGGYPKIGHVIAADLTGLAQLNANQSIQFELTDHTTAENLLLQQHQHLHQLQNACTFRLKEYLSQHGMD